MKSYNYDYADQYLRSVSPKYIALQILIIIVLSLTFSWAWIIEGDHPFSWIKFLIIFVCTFLLFVVPSYLTLHFAKRDACFEMSYFAQGGMLFSILTGALGVTLLLFVFQNHGWIITIIMGTISGALGGAVIGTIFTLIYWCLFISRNRKIILGMISCWLTTISYIIIETIF